jgi:hypothetical protein
VVFALLILADLAVVGLQVERGVPTERVARGFIRLALTVGLFWCVWQGAVWARVLLCVLLAAGAVLVALVCLTCL